MYYDLISPAVSIVLILLYYYYYKSFRILLFLEIIILLNGRSFPSSSFSVSFTRKPVLSRFYSSSSRYSVILENSKSSVCRLIIACLENIK